MLTYGVRRLLSLKNRQMCSQSSFPLCSRKILLFSKKWLNKKIFSIQFLIKKSYIHFVHKLTPSKKCSCSQKIFPPIFSKNLLFSKKIVRWKNIQNLIFYRKGYINFCRRTKIRPPEMSFSCFLGKYSFFFEKIVK